MSSSFPPPTRADLAKPAPIDLRKLRITGGPRNSVYVGLSDDMPQFADGYLVYAVPARKYTYTRKDFQKAGNRVPERPILVTPTRAIQRGWATLS